MCPYLLCRSRIRSKPSTRSRLVSPMPTRRPVVKGIRSHPARSKTFSLTSGSLSGHAACGIPGSSSSLETDSSMSPIDPDTSLSLSSSASDMTPAFTWGMRDVSSRMAAAHAYTYSIVDEKPSSLSSSAA